MDEDELKSAMAGMMQMMMGSAFAEMGIGGSDLSQCAEGNWSRHPVGELFRAVKDQDCEALSVLLQQDEYIDHVDDWDGDGAPALTQLPFQHKVSEQVAQEIVSIFKEAGANLNVRSSKMYSSETPLHIAATYGNLAAVKALVDAGAQVTIKDDRGRTPLDNAKKALSKEYLASRGGNPQACIDYLKEAFRSGNGSTSVKNTKSEAQIKRGKVIQSLADRYYRMSDYDKAAEEYSKLLACCGDDSVVYANLAAAYNHDAVERLMAENGSGYRQKFKDTYENATRAVELDPSYERGWYLLCRGYLGFRELPRAKKAAKDGYLNCPSSEALKTIWDVLHSIGIPDEVADHDSFEWKETYRRLYVARWIGDVACHCCGLSCMDDPPPGLCPFCNCPTSIDLDEDEEGGDLICAMTVTDEFQDIIDDISGEKKNTNTNNAFESSNSSNAKFSLGSSDAVSGTATKRTGKKKKGKGKGRKGKRR